MTTIGASPFSGCVALKEVALPEAIRLIGSQSFANTGLSELCLPVSVQEGASPGLTRAGQVLYVDRFAAVTFYANGEAIGEAKGTCNRIATVSFDLNQVAGGAFKNKQLKNVKISATISR